MKRFTLLMAGMLCASASFATDYYVSVDGAGEKNGSSVENALDFATMYANVNAYAMGMYSISQVALIMCQLMRQSLPMVILLSALLRDSLLYSLAT